MGRHRAYFSRYTFFGNKFAFCHSYQPSPPNQVSQFLIKAEFFLERERGERDIFLSLSLPLSFSLSLNTNIQCNAEIRIQIRKTMQKSAIKVGQKDALLRRANVLEKKV